MVHLWMLDKLIESLIELFFNPWIISMLAYLGDIELEISDHVELFKSQIIISSFEIHAVELLVKLLDNLLVFEA
jgi:hypothetical protein